MYLCTILVAVTFAHIWMTSKANPVRTRRNTNNINEVLMITANLEKSLQTKSKFYIADIQSILMLQNLWNNSYISKYFFNRS